MPDPATPRRGLVIGCGGTLGFAWSAIALQALEHELGWDARTAEVLVGTSAGSEMAALLGSGRSTDEIVAGLIGHSTDPIVNAHFAHDPGNLPPVPGLGLSAAGLLAAGLRRRVDLTAAAAGLLPRGRGDATWLRELGDALATSAHWVSHPATWLVAADVRTGKRVAFGRPDAPTATLGQALAASWAIPGWFPPAPVHGDRYVDGGVVSSASADLVAGLGLDEVVILAPMTSAEPAPGGGLSRVERLLRRRMTSGLDREVTLLRTQGATVIRVEPTQDDLHAMGFNFMDARRRSSVITTAQRTSPDRVRAAISQGVLA